MNLVSKKVEVYFSVIDGKIINGTMLCNSLNFTRKNAYCNKLNRSLKARFLNLTFKGSVY